MSLRNKLLSSIYNMGIQRLIEFLTIFTVTTIIVRSLSREEYGVLAMILSYGLLYNFFNISISSILLRDYHEMKYSINSALNAFLLFSIIKCIPAILVTIIICVFLYMRYQSSLIIIIFLYNFTTIIFMYIVEPFNTLLSVDFKQSVLTKFYLISSLINLVLTIGAVWLPSAFYVVIKNFIVSFLSFVMPIWYVHKHYNFQICFNKEKHFKLIKSSIMYFSLWSHLISIMTDTIYRADILILGLFNPSFKTLGNYNVALQMGNFTKTFPQILQLNTTLCLSNIIADKQRAEETTVAFVKYSLLLSLITMAAYVGLGRLVIGIIAKTDIEEIFIYGLYIIGGLCIFNSFRPLISYIIIFNNIKLCFLQIFLPSTVITLICYLVMGNIWGAIGLASANLISGIVITIFTVFFVYKRTDFCWRFELITSYEQKIVRNIFAKIKKLLFSD